MGAKNAAAAKVGGPACRIARNEPEAILLSGEVAPVSMTRSGPDSEAVTTLQGVRERVRR